MLRHDHPGAPAEKPNPQRREKAWNVGELPSRFHILWRDTWPDVSELNKRAVARLHH